MVVEEIVNQSVLFLVTFVANLFASVSGGGAGFIQFPMLILLGLPFATALGTHKVAVVFLGIGAMSKKGFGSKGIENRSYTRTILGTICILIIGMFSGSLSSGAGLFATLTLVGVFGLELKRAIMHTMIFVATIWNAVGAITVGALTAIHWQWIPVMIIAAFTGAYLGTTLLIKMPVVKVKFVFSSVSILSGVILILEAFYK